VEHSQLSMDLNGIIDQHSNDNRMFGEDLGMNLSAIMADPDPVRVSLGKSNNRMRF
jgi:hypothetical protein